MKFLRAFLFVLLALAIGSAVALFRIRNFEHSNLFFTNGVWRGTTDLPLGKDPLLTAQITAYALFALPSNEAVYLFAHRDNHNNKLSGANKYTITGNVNHIKARYWSITAYGKDLFLIPNSQNRFGFSSNTLQTDSAGNFTINVSALKQEINWLPVKADAPFMLVFRLYKGEQHFIQNLSGTILPEVKAAQP